MKTVKFNLLVTLLSLLTASAVRAQHTQLRKEINRIAQTTKGKVGVAISLLESGDTLTYNNQGHYVLHSVAKYAVALDMLHEIDQKHFKLNQLIHITKADLPPLYSPLREKYPNGNVDISVAELLSNMISLSDNNACDILYKQLGGTRHVNQFIHGLGITQMEIEATEADMASAWPVQYTDWTQPYEQIKLLKLLYSDSLLSKKSNDYLWKIMLATSTAPKRLKGLLPAGTAVAHKSGTSGTNAQGLSPATNDMGIILLPNGKHMAIAVFITDALENDNARDLIIAKIAKAAYNDFKN
jgi:beta-lactamase class A